MIANDGRNTARLLGYAGLIPFYALAVAAFLLSDAMAESALLLLLAYAAVIASFMGAVHWGLAMARPEPAGRVLLRSVLPALAGWTIVALHVLSPVAWPGIVLAIALFVALHVHDRNAAKAGLAPAWYGVMRAPLSILVIAALLIGLAATF